MVVVLVVVVGKRGTTTKNYNISIYRTKPLDDNNFIFEGKISLNDFLKVVKGEKDYFEEIKGESDSLAGLVLELEGRILKIGESCRIAPYTLLVESTDVRRIKRFKVSIDVK